MTFYILSPKPYDLCPHAGESWDYVLGVHFAELITDPTAWPACAALMPVWLSIDAAVLQPDVAVMGHMRVPSSECFLQVEVHAVE